MANSLLETVVNRIVADQTESEVELLVEELCGSGLMTQREQLRHDAAIRATDAGATGTGRTRAEFAGYFFDIVEFFLGG